MAESAKRHKENSNIIKEIRASTDAAIRNQGASIKTLEIQIGQMSKVLQERGIGGSHHRSIFSETVPFPRRLQDYCCDDWRKELDVKILEAYDHTLPQKEKDPGSFTLPCFIHNACFDKAFVDLGVSVSVMPFSTYTNLGLGILSHTRLIIELADRTIKQPRGIAENVIGYKNVNADFIPSFSINLITKIFYYSLNKDKDSHKGKNPAETLIDIPIFVGKFSILAGFIIIDDKDVIRDGVLSRPFFMKYVSCQMIMKKFAHGDKCERMSEEKEKVKLND
ncbi:hypothetical protein Tco_1277961 [Tanacetum coccineum]